MPPVLPWEDGPNRAGECALPLVPTGPLGHSPEALQKDRALAPPFLAAQEVGDEEGEAWQGGFQGSRGKRSQGKALSGFPLRH